MLDCLFCKMVAGDIKPDTVYEDNDVLSFRDINPQAPFHVLVIPKKHIPTPNDMEKADAALIGKLLLTAQQVAQQDGFAEKGYRTVMNCNKDGGQTVFHLHLHVFAGRSMRWPPG